MAGPPRRFYSQSCLHQTSRNLSILVRVFLPLTRVSSPVSAPEFLVQKVSALYVHLFISPALEAMICPMSSPSYGSKKNCWVFNLFSLLIVTVECWHLSSLCRTGGDAINFAIEFFVIFVLIFDKFNLSDFEPMCYSLFHCILWIPGFLKKFSIKNFLFIFIEV